MMKNSKLKTFFDKRSTIGYLTVGDLFKLFVPPLLIFGAICVLLSNFVYLGYVPSRSMEPTVTKGSFIFADRRSYLDARPACGDIVIINFNDHSERDTFCKRVVGLPGDLIQLKKGMVYVNGEKLEEPYTVGKTNPHKKVVEFEVPEGHYFVMGDNRTMSSDSRDWDNPFVPVDKIIARKL